MFRTQSAIIYWCMGCVHVRCNAPMYWYRRASAVSSEAKQPFRVNPCLLSTPSTYITGEGRKGQCLFVKYEKGCQMQSFFLNTEQVASRFHIRQEY